MRDFTEIIGLFAIFLVRNWFKISITIVIIITIFQLDTINKSINYGFSEIDSDLSGMGNMHQDLNDIDNSAQEISSSLQNSENNLNCYEIAPIYLKNTNC